MDSSKIRFLLFWCYSVLNASPGSTITVEDRLSIIKSIFYSKFWTTEVISRDIIIDNKIVTLRTDFEKVLQQYPSYDKEKSQNRSVFLFKVSKAMYTTLTCEFSDLIISTLYFFFECVSSCQNLKVNRVDSALEKDFTTLLKSRKKKCTNDFVIQFVGLKRFFVKMLYNLINFTRISVNLKSTDNSIIKYLMSINVFLNYLKHYYSGKSDDDDDDGRGKDVARVIDAKKTFTQMINLVERFRSKHCYDSNFFTFTKVIKEKINELPAKGDTFFGLVDKIFEPTLQKLKKSYTDELLVKTNSLGISRYATDMFDAKYILLEQIFEIDEFEFISFITVKWDKTTETWKSLREIYAEVETCGDLKTMFEYQVLVIEVIKELFYVQFIELYARDDRKKIHDLLGIFEEFVKCIVPKNYPTKLYTPIIKLKNAMHADLLCTVGFDADDKCDKGDKNADGKRVLSADTVNILHENTIIKTWDEVYTAREYVALSRSESMADLLKRVQELEHFGRFKETFELMAREWHALGEYRLHRLSDHERIGDNNAKFCHDISQLRRNLFVFQLQLYNIQTAIKRSVVNLKDDCVLKSVKDIYANVLILRTMYGDVDRAIERILLPMAVGLLNAAEKFRIHHVLALKQISLFTVNSLEYHQLTVCHCPENGLEIITGVLADGNVYVPLDQRDVLHIKHFWKFKSPIQKWIENATQQFRINKTTLAVYSKPMARFVPGETFDHYGAFNLTTFFLDGDRVLANDARRNLFLNEIDYQKFAVYLMRSVKWVLANVFAKVLYVLDAFFATEPGNEPELSEMVKAFRPFWEFSFPDFVNVYVRDIFNLFMAVLVNPEKRNPAALRSLADLCREDVVEQIDLFGAVWTDDEHDTQKSQWIMKDVQISFTEDLEHLINMFKFIDHTDVLIDIDFSSSL